MAFLKSTILLPVKITGPWSTGSMLNTLEITNRQEPSFRAGHYIMGLYWKWKSLHIPKPLLTRKFCHFKAEDKFTACLVVLWDLEPIGKTWRMASALLMNSGSLKVDATASYLVPTTFPEDPRRYRWRFFHLFQPA
jgi:hypothetical protein